MFKFSIHNWEIDLFSWTFSSCPEKGCRIDSNWNGDPGANTDATQNAKNSTFNPKPIFPVECFPNFDLKYGNASEAKIPKIAPIDVINPIKLSLAPWV